MAIRNELIERLRVLDPKTVAELERVERAISALDPTDIPASIPGEFASITIIEAVKQYLQRVKREATVEELTKALIYGGAGGKGERAPEWKIRQSIGYHASRGNLRVTETMVGLPEWDAKPKG